MAVRVGLAARAQAYWQAFDRLLSARRLEELAGELTRIADESAQNSGELWRRWLRLMPGRWEPEQRKLLGNMSPCCR